MPATPIQRLAESLRKLWRRMFVRAPEAVAPQDMDAAMERLGAELRRRLDVAGK